jgi:hypothetical protein
VKIAGAGALRAAGRPDELLSAPISAVPQSVTAASRRVADALMTLGPSRVSAIAMFLGFSSAAVNKHLDQLEDAGWVIPTFRAPYGPGAVAPTSRGRGRPARLWTLTTVGTESLAARAMPTDDCAALATAAMRYVKDTVGLDGVAALARNHADSMKQAWIARNVTSASNLAQALAAQGFAAVAVEGLDGSAQVCQHHCPIHDVAAEFPVFCEMETSAMSEVLGVNVVRLATIAGGSPICTTMVPARVPDEKSPARPAQLSTPAATSTTPTNGATR